MNENQILSQIHSPDDVKQLEENRLGELATAWHTLGFDTSMCRATSTERTIPRFFWRTRMVSR